MKSITISDETYSRMEQIRLAGYDPEIELAAMIKQFCLDIGLENYEE